MGFLLAFTSALLVHYIAPTARGSGIPEVKCILGGFDLPDVLSLKTLVPAGGARTPYTKPGTEL